MLVLSHHNSQPSISTFGQVTILTQTITGPCDAFPVAIQRRNGAPWQHSKAIDGEKTIVLTGITNTQNNENIQKMVFFMRKSLIKLKSGFYSKRIVFKHECQTLSPYLISLVNQSTTSPTPLDC